MPEPFVMPVLGFGDEGFPSYTVTWKSGQVICRGYGLLGSYPAPEEETAIIIPEEINRGNVVSFSEFKEKKDAKAR